MTETNEPYEICTAEEAEEFNEGTKESENGGGSEAGDLLADPVCDTAPMDASSYEDASDGMCVSEGDGVAECVQRDVSVSDEADASGGSDVPEEDGGSGCGFEGLMSEDHGAFTAALLTLYDRNALSETAGRQLAYAEMRAFERLYPEVAYENLPREVRESSLPPVAAYAVYERVCAYAAKEAEKSNENNAARSAGRLTNTGEGVFSPEEVRRMTQAEVHLHYDEILRAMRTWK